MLGNYEKQTLDNPNPIARYAHRTRFARSKAAVLAALKQGSTIVDYGCGQGRFLHELKDKLSEQNKECDLLGYDPFMAAKFDGYEVVADVNQIENKGVDVVTCLEVCEHLDETETQGFIDFVEAKLASGGTLLITAPIMIGPALLLKELSRSVLFRRKSDTSIIDILLASFFCKVPRRAENIKLSHRGYDWRGTLKTMEKNFTLEKVEFSPILFLGGYGNSQVFMFFKKP